MTKHYNTAGHAHELTYSCNHKLSYFQDEMACRIFLDCIRTSSIKFNFHLWAYVVMPSHVHLLIWPCENGYDIGKIQQAINGTMSYRYSRLLFRINKNYRNSFVEQSKGRPIFRFWQKGGGFDRNIFNTVAIYNSIRYIENNPVKAGLVSQANTYKWSSAWISEYEEKWRPLIHRHCLPIKTVNQF